ncbi:MAG: OmpA family protein [Deltaproteobacteria bacterium]|nr:OmpA family protein [Deltaproteobacteria bacterium]
MKRWLCFAIFPLIFFSSRAVLGRDPSFSAQVFRPSPYTGRYFQLLESGTLPKSSFSFGLMADYAHEPVILERPAGTKFQNLVAKELSANLTGAVGITDWMDVGLLIQTAPYLVFQAADTVIEQTRLRMGDIRLNARLRLLDPKSSPLGLSFVPMVTIPTGNGNSFVGNNQFTGGGLLVLEKRGFNDHFSVAMNAGYEIRERAVLTTTAAGAPQTVINDLFLYGVGANLSLHPRLDLIGEIRGFTVASNFFEVPRPVDYGVGARFYTAPNWAITLGGGSSLISGIGNPVFRAMGGLAYVPTRDGVPRRERKSKDADGDGIKNKKDRCPTEAGPPENGGCPLEAKIVMTPEEYRILTRPIHFAFEKATLKADALPILQVLAEAIKTKPEIKKLSIQGHTDEIGRTVFNQWLSEERALTVKKYLVQQGVSEGRLESIGFGETKPVDPKHSAKAWRLNRRVEFVFEDVDGMQLPDLIPPYGPPATLPEKGPVKVPPVDSPPPPPTTEKLPPSSTQK